MLSTFSHDRLAAAHRAPLERLARARDPRGGWTGSLSSSPLATAAAISALALAERNIDATPDGADALHDSWAGGVLFRSELNELVGQGLRWLAARQNADGGWGDATPGRSNLAATMAVEAAFHLTGVPAKCADMLERAHAYIEFHGGASALRDVEGPRSAIAAGVIALHAAAELSPWRKTPVRWTTLALAGAGRWGPPTAAASAQQVLRTVVALARAANSKQLRPLGGAASGAARSHALKMLQAQQASPGGYFDSPVITGLATCALASAGLADSNLVRHGVEYLLTTVRGDGSWSACGDTAIRDTAAAVAAAHWSPALFGAPDAAERHPAGDASDAAAESALRKLLAAQIAGPGRAQPKKLTGWSSTDRAGVMPSVFDTAQVLVALASCRRHRPTLLASEVRQAATAGLNWLAAAVRPVSLIAYYLPSSEGRAALDVEALALAARAFGQWSLFMRGADEARLRAAATSALEQLAARQRADGAWGPATESDLDESALTVRATAAAVTAYVDLGRSEQDAVRRAARWLAAAQQPCGGWGPNPRLSGSYARKISAADAVASASQCTVEETGSAIAALATFADEQQCDRAIGLGVEWLAESMLADAPCCAAALSLAWSRLWYHDSLAGPIAAVAALDRVLSLAAAPPVEASAAAG